MVLSGSELAWKCKAPTPEKKIKRTGGYIWSQFFGSTKGTNISFFIYLFIYINFFQHFLSNISFRERHALCLVMVSEE
jgi:hypothetical protein